MPIKASALPSPEPDDAAAREQGLPTTEDARTMDAGYDGRVFSAAVTDQASHDVPGEPAKRTRRTKAELIAAAVVPADDDPIALKDSGTGAKIERPWAEAVALVKAEKAEFVDKSLKYAVMKAEQEKAAPAFAPENTQKQDVRYDPARTSHMVKTDEFVDPHGTPYVRIADIHGGHEGTMTLEEWGALSADASPATDAFGRPSPEQLEAARLPTDGSGQMIAPEGAEHGDEVIVGVKTYRVGPGGVLVDGVVDAPSKRRWQRELGTGSEGPWESKAIVHPGAFQQPGSPPAPTSASSSQNGDGGAPKDVTIERERLPHTTEQVDDGSGDGVLKWKIGNGILEKIGLPDYSSLQIGPISISRMVVDDGRRTVVPLSEGREGEVPTAVIEAFEEIDNTVEFIGARFRGQLMSFLQSTGALKQPVS
jgi:hypothetical protein